VAGSGNNCCNEKTISRYVCIVVDLYVPVNNTQRFSAAMRTLQCVMFSLFHSYKMFRTAVNDINLHRY
jgi:hypothetical protein